MKAGARHHHLKLAQLHMRRTPEQSQQAYLSSRQYQLLRSDDSKMRDKCRKSI